VNATYNWWGDASGPYHSVNNPAGTGDNVTDNVLFEPWLTEPWEEVKSPVHNIDKDTYYDTIQAAIDDADPGNRIFVNAGTYYENIIINKTLTLIGEDRNTTIIDGNGTGDVIYISADWVNVSGFGVRNSGMYYCGISALLAPNISISNCNISDNFKGVYLDFSSDSIITSCDICLNQGDGIHVNSSAGIIIDNCVISLNNYYGVCLWCSSANSIINCAVYNNFWAGISHYNSSDNNINGCNIYNNSYEGISLYYSSNNNQITNCAVYNNYEYGIYLYKSSNNKIHYCNIYGNINYGVRNYNSEIAYQVDATYNWWGHVSGPGGQGPGTGDKVSSNVLYDPWLNSVWGEEDNTPPTSSVDIISPYWQISTPFTITATVFYDNSGIANVSLYYRYSNDNSSWSSWILFGTDYASPWSWEFNFPEGIGYYQFYSIAVDNAGNTEPAPETADAICGYDDIAPIVTITGVEDDAYYNTDRAIEFTATDDYLSTVVMQNSSVFLIII